MGFLLLDIKWQLIELKNYYCEYTYRIIYRNFWINYYCRWILGLYEIQKEKEKDGKERIKKIFTTLKKEKRASENKPSFYLNS